jgi:hypothetical protein
MLPTAAFAAGEAPDIDAARQAIERKLMAAKPADVTERNVVLREVVAGASGTYQATMMVRDYSPGFPANHFYGETCVAKVDRPGWTFSVVRNSLGDWQADGRTTLQQSEGRACKPNPAAGVSSQPLAGIQ